MTRLGMVVDLKRCIGCYACMVACKQENGVPPGVFLTRVHHREYGRYPKVRKFYLPVLCNHCGDPVCVEACPSLAIYRREDGVVLVDEEKCCGSRACVAACPYGQIFFPLGERTYYPDTVTPFEEHHKNLRKPGTAVKCTLCAHRLDQELEPACVATCPTEARIFGDLDDPDSKPSRHLRERAARGESFVLRPEVGMRPNVVYLPWW